MNVNYVIVEASVISRSTNINLKFKRLATNEELESHKENDDTNFQMMKKMFPPSMHEMFMNNSCGPKLEFEYVDMKVSLDEFKNSDLNVGSVVSFSIPTSLMDITTTHKQLI